MEPATAMLILGAASAASSAGGSIAAGKMNRRGERVAREQLAQQKAQQDQDVAVKESMLDPFRQQMSQATDISALDRMERGSYTPVKLQGGPSRYAGNTPSFAGGFSYEKSPELIASAGALKRNVMGGNVAPTQTNPANRGKTATLDLLRIASDGVDPGTVNGASGPPRDVSTYAAGVDRREPGASGRGQDVSVGQAQQILTQAIQSELGRPPNPGEIDAMLAGQGLKPGDRWVGNTGLTALLNSLRQSAMPQPSYTGLA